MGLIAFVIYYTGKTDFLWSVIIRFPCINLGGDLKTKQEKNNEK